MTITFCKSRKTVIRSGKNEKDEKLKSNNNIVLTSLMVSEDLIHFFYNKLLHPIL